MTRLDEIAIERMTMREVMIKAFNDDWNTRKRILTMRPRETCVVSITFTVHVDVDIAKEVLKSLDK